jgi:hypothetical protein
MSVIDHQPDKLKQFYRSYYNENTGPSNPLKFSLEDVKGVTSIDEIFADAARQTTQVRDPYFDHESYNS